MGRIEVDLFTTLDLVSQAPGSRSEDPEGGFAFGGWQAPLPDEVVGEQIMAGIAALDALLLGRKTYDIFASYWPHKADDFAGGIAGKFNSVPKYVASRGRPKLTWDGTTQFAENLPQAVREIRERHENIHVIGSLDLFQTLLAERLFDRLNLFVYPIVLGQGKKVFENNAVPSVLRLTEPAVSTPAGTLLLHYELTDGVPQTGEMDSESGQDLQ